MKRKSFLLSMSMSLILFSCNNGPAKEEAKTPDTTASATNPPPAEVKPAFTPFKVVAIQHKVKNFDKAVAGYFRRDSLLQAYGITHLVFARDMKDTNQVFIIDKIEDIEKTKSFFE